MADLIIPNWHPFLVHFTIALTVTSTAFFVLGQFFSGQRDTFATVAKWTLWSAAFVTVLTLFAGFSAYNSVDHDDVAHVVMKTHRFWALIAAGAMFLLAFWVYRAKAVSAVIVAASLVVTGLVGATGYLGAELVYRHGLGVMRLPDSSGAGHSHADGGDHDHGPAVNESAEHDHGGAGDDSHDHGASESMSETMTEEHGHADGGHDHGDADMGGHDHAAPEAASEEHSHADGGHDHGDGGHGASGTMSDPASMPDMFLAALKAGNVAAVDALLADDVLIIEGGHAQSGKAAYMEGHMKSDMKFVPNMTYETLSRETGQAGDRAWVVTFSRSKGSFMGKDYDRTGREFMLLRRVGDTWKIAMVEWADK